MLIFTERSANTTLDSYIRSGNSPFDPEDRYDLIDPRQMIDDLNIRNDRTFSSEKIDTYLSNLNLTNYYNKAVIDSFFSGESSGKKLIDWSNIQNKNGSDFAFTFNQEVPNTVWVINHNLGYYPGGVSSFDSSEEEMVGEVTHDSVNQLTITFSSSFSGYVYLS